MGEGGISYMRGIHTEQNASLLLRYTCKHAPLQILFSLILLSYPTTFQIQKKKKQQHTQVS